MNELWDKGSKTTSISSLEVAEQTSSSQNEIVEEWNSYFVNVGPIASLRIYHLVTWKKIAMLHQQKKKLLTDVFKLISCVKGKKAYGPDKISAKLIKDLASIITDNNIYHWQQYLTVHC